MLQRSKDSLEQVTVELRAEGSAELKQIALKMRTLGADARSETNVKRKTSATPGDNSG